jgi:hypothetical protein
MYSTVLSNYLRINVGKIPLIVLAPGFLLSKAVSDINIRTCKAIWLNLRTKKFSSSLLNEVESEKIKNGRN